MKDVKGDPKLTVSGSGFLELESVTIEKKIEFQFIH